MPRPRSRWRRLVPAALLNDERLRPVRAALARLFHWLEARVRGFYSALGLLLAMGLGLAMGAVWGFAALAESVAEGETARMDERVLRWIDGFGSPALDLAAVEVTALGDSVVVVVLVLVSSLLLWLTRHRDLAAMLWLAALGGVVINTALKLAFDRPRPRVFEWRVDYAGLSSFPSGHATIAMVVYTALAYVVLRLEPTRRLRAATLAVFAVLVFLIGLSRLYLGVHYPSDVLAGYAVGFAWTVFAALSVEAVRHARAGPEEEDGADAPGPG